MPTVPTTAEELRVAMPQGTAESRSAPEQDTLPDRLRAKSEEAADELVVRYADRLLRAAVLLLGGDMSFAEDAVQETLLAAVTHIHQFRGDSSLYSWPYTILLRWCRRHRRRSQRQGLLFTDPDADPAAGTLAGADDPAPIEAAFEQAYQRQRITQAVLDLPDAYSEVIVLFYYEDFSVDEISRLLGKASGTVKSLLHRARQRLALILEEDRT